MPRGSIVAMTTKAPTSYSATVADDSELTLQTPLHYRCMKAFGTWANRAILGLDRALDPELVPRGVLGMQHGAGKGCRLCARTHTQLGQQAVDMVLDGVYCDAELIGDIAIGQA